MAAMSEEEKFARAMGKSLDRMNINFGMVVANFVTRNSGVQSNMFEMILTFLNKYASLYAFGDVVEGDRMYKICQMSHQMICALDGPKYWETSTGRHCNPND